MFVLSLFPFLPPTTNTPHVSSYQLMATLAQAVQGLPAELYNNILDFVLTHDEDVVTIDQRGFPYGICVLHALAKT